MKNYLGFLKGYISQLQSQQMDWSFLRQGHSLWFLLAQTHFTTRVLNSCSPPSTINSIRFLTEDSNGIDGYQENKNLKLLRP